MDSDITELLRDLLAKVDEMYEVFSDLKPMIARYKMIGEASNLREARKALKNGR